MGYQGYGPPAYGPPGGYGPSGYGYGYGGPGEPPASRGNAIGALIANILGLCACLPFGIAGVVLAIVALTKVDDNPRTSRTCAILAWVSFALALVGLAIYLFVYGAALLTDPELYY